MIPAVKNTALIVCTPIVMFCTLGCVSSGESERPVVSMDSINFAHLEHLQQVIEVNGRECRIVYIYSKTPDYRLVGDEDEGIACVDDVARAARLYLKQYSRISEPALLDRAESMLNFVLAMQAEDGEFYNFIRHDGSINAEHRNSRKDYGWWMARGFRALAEGMRVFNVEDRLFNSTLSEAAERSIGRIRRDRLSLAEPHAIGSDVAAEFVLGLLAYREATGDANVEPLIESYCDQIVAMSRNPDEHLPYLVHRSWRNHWHAWGHSQVEALVRAGRVFGREDWTASGRMEADGFDRWRIAGGGPVAIEFLDGQPPKTRDYPQIAYNISSLVSSQVAMYEFTRDAAYANLAGIAASWLAGNNEAGSRMYDPLTGRCFDGIDSPEEVNRNSGAESTIEALLALTMIADLPDARRAYSARR